MQEICEVHGSKAAASHEYSHGRRFTTIPTVPTRFVRSRSYYGHILPYLHCQTCLRQVWWNGLRVSNDKISLCVDCRNYAVVRGYLTTRFCMILRAWALRKRPNSPTYPRFPRPAYLPVLPSPPFSLTRVSVSPPWLPDCYSQIFRMYVFGPSGLKE